jgi:hypothetical protein
MTGCEIQMSGAIELYFYDELDAGQRSAVERHLPSCSHCAHALDELRVIRAALSSRPDVSAPASGDWSGFMARLDSAIDRERTVASVAAMSPAPARRSYVAYFAMAALLALITLSVVLVMPSRSPQSTPMASMASDPRPGVPPVRLNADTTETPESADFTALSEEHFERSKLVVLGLATKDPAEGRAADWTYERDLARQLLSDTRMYRLAAEDRGLASIAGVMRDLEMVLLQTSLTDEKDPAALPQLQRLIQKRDLLEKMDVVARQPADGLQGTKGI